MRLLLILALLAVAAGSVEAFRPRGGGPIAASATGSVPFVLPSGSSLRYMSPTGSDGANGLTPGTAWATPNHAMNCGDVIIAASGTYSASGISGWGTVSNCPSTTGGIDGAGGVYFATLLCGGAAVGDCHIDHSGSSGVGMRNDHSNWSVQGWRVSSNSIGGTGARGFEANACASGTTIVHHIAYINNIATHTQTGFNTNECALNHNVPGNGVDYFAVVGNIAHNANSDVICLGSIDNAGPANSDTVAGVHVFWAGNFAIANIQSAGCPSDGEAFILDTLDAHGYVGTLVIRDNIVYSSSWANSQIFMQGWNSSAPIIKVFNNTSFNGNVGALGSSVGTSGDFNNQLDGGFPWNIAYYNNIVKTNRSSAPNSSGTYGVYAFLMGGASGPSGMTIATGGSGIENIFNGTAGQNTITFNGFTTGTNLTSDPALKNTADLLANHVGTPNCSGFETTTACMGWVHATRTASSLSVIDDMTATAGAAAGKGYRPPGDCAADAFYPTWLKGVVYLHWDGVALTQKDGLAQKPCGI